MLHFLRKIRRTLIESSSTRKYLLYAVGEIVLVVLGILIALQINNWNEHRKSQNKIKVYLENLKNDLQNDIQEMDYMESANTFRYHSMQYLLDIAGLPNYNAPKDELEIGEWKLGHSTWEKEIPSDYDTTFVELAFLHSHRIGYGLISTTTVDELKNTGLYSQMSNVELKQSIEAYYDLITFRMGTREAYQPIIEDWVQSLVEEGIQNGNPYIYGDPVKLIKNDKQRSGYLRRVIRQSGWLLEGAQIISNEAQKLIDLIDQELRI